MDFGREYLSYSDYKIMGGNLEQNDFNIYQQKAKLVLDRETQNRLNDIEDIPKEVKICLFELIETMAFDKNYRDIEIEGKIRFENGIIYNLLSRVVVNGVSLLYRGVR